MNPNKGFVNLALVLTFILYAPLALAVRVQILHTNDLHSYLDNTGTDPQIGGYPAIKKIFDHYRQLGKEQGLPTLVFDAGDFLEGHLFYKAENGRRSLRAHEMLGFDAVVVGNHEYLMGTDDFDALIGEVRPEFPFLCANLFVDPRFTNIREFIKPYKVFDVEGVKIGVMGLTTNSRLYTWRINEGSVASPIATGLKVSSMLKKKEDVDYVFALTHIGLGVDKILAMSSRHIDFIIGGHSHDLLKQPEVVSNQKLKPVPIVQTGAHGERVGRMILELEKGQPVKIVHYETIVVENDEVDQEMNEFVQESRQKVEDRYGKAILSEPLGFSLVSLTHSKKGTTFWGDFIADAIREAVDADIGIHTIGFAGHDQGPGTVTLETIINAYPRFFEFDRDMGWTIYQAKVPGFVLKMVLDILVKTGLPLNISGVKFDVKWFGGIPMVTNLTIRGKRVNPLKRYVVAMPEGIARGGPYVTRTYSYLFKHTANTEVPIWTAIKEKVLRTGTLSPSSLQRGVDRTMVPESDYLLPLEL